MSNYPKYIEIEGKIYNINTDFRVALECNRIAEDSTIGDFERAMGILCTLFGEESLDNPSHYEILLELAKKYLTCGKELEKRDEKIRPDMDFDEDMSYIEASFMSDYKIDLEHVQMHWWKFNELLIGLSDSEFGNCCVLNRVRNIRNKDLSKIKDRKERQMYKEAQERLALKKYKKKPTESQQRSADEFLKQMGFI